MHHIARSTPWSKKAAASSQREACRESPGRFGPTGQGNSRCRESRIIDGMSKPRRRSIQKVRQARSSQAQHKAVDTAGSAQRPSQTAGSLPVARPVPAFAVIL
jgi:hypothetical protein